jgi:FMN reductase [NAD(P)H]
MDFADILKRRRMVRRFSTDPIPKDALERIAAAAKRAPSAGFSQGQRLLVVTDPELKTRVAAGADEDAYPPQWDHWISRCGAQFVPCVSEQLYHERYQQPDKLEDDGTEIVWPVPYWWMDIGCTVMLILLAAVNEGLAAGFAGPVPHPNGTNIIRAALRIPDHFTPVGVIPVGHPLPDAPSPSLKRGAVKPEDFVRWNGW